MNLTLGEIADWIHAEGVFDTSVCAHGYSIDTRTLAAGDLYFAVKGERLDGHDFIDTAIANGAIAAVASMRWLAPAGFDDTRLLRVPDECEDCVLEAVQTLANRVRRRWGKRVIGVTGSAGKTTTKECIAAVLGMKFNVLKTEGNLNNHFGVPLSLLRLQHEHDVLVLEMGMNHTGEIAALAKIAEPNWAVVSNVGMAHTEFFTDGIEGIARAKYELVQALPADGLAFLNADDARVRRFAAGLGDRAVLYGTADAATVRAEQVADRGLNGTQFKVVIAGQQAAPKAVSLRLPGRHNVLNAIAAIAVGARSGIDLATAVAAMEALRPTEKRGNQIRRRGAEIINDTYNSNPAALLSMIEALRNTDAERRILVAGEMLELGAEGARLHAECGVAAAIAGIDVVLGVRGLAAEIVRTASDAGVHAEFVETPEAAGTWLHEHLRAGDVVLLKASRGVRLEHALDALRDTSE